MSMWHDDCRRFAQEDIACSDSLLLDRLARLGEKELECIEKLCESVDPGPLVVDDVAAGEGVVVATLPDGRHIVSLTSTGSVNDPDWVSANARLICRARYFLLRLLHDRRRWQEEREKLLARIKTLEAGLGESLAASRPSQPR